MNLINKIFSFVETPVKTLNFSLFRIALGIFCMLKILIVMPVVYDLYGQYGIIQWAVSKAAIGPYLPHLGDINYALTHALSISADNGFYLLFGIYLFGLMCLTMGLLSRVMSVLCWLQHLAWMNTGGAFMYGVDVFTQMSLFYLVFMPTDRCLSLDNVLHLRRRKSYSVGGGIIRRVFQFQMCIMYFSSGVEKASSIQWRNGEAIWRALTMPSFRQFDFSWMSSYILIPVLIGWLTVLAETSYAVLVWIPGVRVLALLAIFSMHLAIGLFMGMWLFSFIMMIISLFCFGEECYQDLNRHSSTFFKKRLAY